MLNNNYIELNRQFSLVSKNQDDAENNEMMIAWGYSKPFTWKEVEKEYRCVILAEAGSGKTEELRQRAAFLSNQSKPSFFIRIEDIESDFYDAFEIGEEKTFTEWLESEREAWFFLDSVDEARLESPRAFEKAIRKFAKGIKAGSHRAHIIISSRPYAWRPNDDKRLLDAELFFPDTMSEKSNSLSKASQINSALKLYGMRPLDEERIRCFCNERGMSNVRGFLREVEKTNLWGLAERPFDLEGMICKWNDDKTLGGRLELLSHNIEKRLSEDHNVDRCQRQFLNLDQARKGGRRLAAAVVLTGKAGLNVADSNPLKPGIEPHKVLSDWGALDVNALLERGIFNDVLYGVVRFRHREIRELLAAEWFKELLDIGGPRRDVESLFFKESYGEKIIVPRLRHILPWLILFDEGVRDKALSISPEIALEGGEPTLLSLIEQKNILSAIVHRISLDEDDRGVRDNQALARIANPRLSECVLTLIEKNIDNDDVIFFLGRLVWQGEMKKCVEPLIKIGADNSRGKYARIASIRAIMNCGSSKQKEKLWNLINKSTEEISRELLAELIEWTDPDINSVDYLAESLKKVSDYQRFNSTGLSRSLHEYVCRLPQNNNSSLIKSFIEAIHEFLVASPYIERRDCRVSEKYAWLLGIALHAVERLVQSKCSVALNETSVSIMLMVPSLRHWRGEDYKEYKDELHKLVPKWPSLNDALYWASIEQARRARETKSPKTLDSDWSVSWMGHFWKFDIESLPRLIEFMKKRKSKDDRLVALSTAFRIYMDSEKQKSVLKLLESAVKNESFLNDRLIEYLNPKKTEKEIKLEQRHQEYLRKQESKEESERLSRDAWIVELRKDPDRVRNPAITEAGDWTKDQYWLLNEVVDKSLDSSSPKGAEWRELIPEFGEGVAKAYRDATKKYWRLYKPPIPSEGANKEASDFNKLSFAFAGLDIEFSEIDDLSNHLNESEITHALRYLTWELNGLPHWFERLYRAFPSLVRDLVVKEVFWELDNSSHNSKESTRSILGNLANFAPWIHKHIAADILKWIESSSEQLGDKKSSCIKILDSGGIEHSILASLAIAELAKSNDYIYQSWWYALFVHCDPERGIEHVEGWLSKLDKDEAIHASQLFVVALMGGRHATIQCPMIGRFKEPKHLKSLYILMHKYIRKKDDTERRNGIVYSPSLRDDAQEARSMLFSIISEHPGKASYIVTKQLVQEHPEPDYRPWMAKQAYKRAEEDGDIEVWSEEQVCDFSKLQTIKPKSHKQLFELAISKLSSLKYWLEYGNDSPWKTWQKAEEETEMRTLVAGWLNNNCLKMYTTAQEPELANTQRMDIWLHNTYIKSPVPIELKLLDKNWSGPKLCERLRNQLVGDYLREESASCGVMLLVAQKLDAKKKWSVNGRMVKLPELGQALKEYWYGIADLYPHIDQIEIIVIDLSLRGSVSRT